MTVEEFVYLQESRQDFNYELHFGELVRVGRANKRHYDLQLMIQDILMRLLGTRAWKIGIEMPK